MEKKKKFYYCTFICTHMNNVVHYTACTWYHECT